MELLGIQFAKSSSEITLTELWINLNRLIEIADSQLMVAHVLINNSSRNENSFIVWNLFQNFGEALQGLLELICFVIHQTKMEATTYEVLLEI